jgi:very-short-patch-repair endonuclease
MVPPDVLVARRAARNWGVLSLQELRACGLTVAAVKSRVANGRLHQRHRGVYAVGHPNVPLEGRFLGAAKACGPEAWVSHRAVASLWNLLPWSGGRIEVTVLGPGTRRHAGVLVHRTGRLDPADIAVVRGIPVTSPARTLVDLAAVLDERRLRRAVRQAQSLKLCSIADVLAALDRAGRRRGRRKLLRVVATGPAPTRSELEDVVLDLMLRGGLEHPNVNVPLVLGGRRIVPDFRWPRERFVVEADGAAWHDNSTAREDDAERQAVLEAHGERVVRVTWDQAVQRPEQTLARLRAAGAPAAA